MASTVEVQRFFTNGDRVVVAGFTGYDAEETRNMRIYLRNLQLTGNKATSEIGVCKLFSFYFLKGGIVYSIS